MATKKTITSLLTSLEKHVEALEKTDMPLEKQLQRYQESLRLSGELNTLLTQHKEAFEVLDNQADSVMGSL